MVDRKYLDLCKLQKVSLLGNYTCEKLSLMYGLVSGHFCCIDCILLPMNEWVPRSCLVQHGTSHVLFPGSEYAIIWQWHMCLTPNWCCLGFLLSLFCIPVADNWLWSSWKNLLQVSWSSMTVPSLSQDPQHGTVFQTTRRTRHLYRHLNQSSRLIFLNNRMTAINLWKSCKQPVTSPFSSASSGLRRCTNYLLIIIISTICWHMWNAPISAVDVSDVLLVEVPHRGVNGGGGTE